MPSVGIMCLMCAFTRTIRCWICFRFAVACAAEARNVNIIIKFTVVDYICYNSSRD